MTHVLIAEDDAAIRNLLSAVLRKQGFHIVAVEDGAAALRHIAAAPVDVLLLDLMMPRLSGWGVVDELFRRGSTLTDRTIVLTAAADADVARLPRSIRVMQKPFDIQQLVREIRALGAPSEVPLVAAVAPVALTA